MSGPKVSIDEAMLKNMALADFGMQVNAFLETRIGKYLVQRAEEEVERCMQVLKKVDATDAKAVMRAQGELWRAESFMYWMADAIRTGTEITNQLLSESERHASDNPNGGDATGS